MGWVRVSDDFYDHPKFTEAGPLGTALWLAGMAYCNRNLTDGYIPASRARGLLDFDGLMLQTAIFAGSGAIEDDLAPWASATLIVVGLWHEDGHDCPSCPQPGPRRYYVHDYLEYQPSKAQVEETKAVRAAAGRKGGQARGKQSAKQVAQHTAKQTAEQTLKQNGSKNQPQSQVPIPTPNPLPNPRQDSDENQSVLQMVAETNHDLTSVARFRKFDPAAIKAELGAIIPAVTDEDVVNVAIQILDRAPATVRNPTRYLIAAIQNDEYDIETITYGGTA